MFVVLILERGLYVEAERSENTFTTSLDFGESLYKDNKTMVTQEDNNNEFATKHCFRCGAINSKVHESETLCEQCGEESLYTLIEALDKLNDLYVRGLFRLRR